MIITMLPAALPSPPPLYEDPAWIGVGVGILTIIATIWIGLYVYSKQRSKKEITYRLFSDTPIIQPEASGLVQVLINGITKENPRLALLELRNTGNVPIEAKDFERTISISFNDPREILSAGIIDKFHDDLQPAIKNNTKEVTIEPLLLNPKEFIELQILSSAQDTNKSKIKVEIRATGVEPKGYEEIEKEIKRRFIIGIITMLTGMLIFVAGVLTNLPPVPTQPLITRPIPSFYLITTVIGMTTLLIGYFLVMQYAFRRDQRRRRRANRRST